MANGLSKNMVKYITNRKGKEEVLNGFEPLIEKWFNSKFDDLTPPQSMAVPLIHNKENVLVSSPTGSGKTLTAFLSIINNFLRLHKENKFEDGVHAIYVSPLFHEQSTPTIPPTSAKIESALHNALSENGSRTIPFGGNALNDL